MARQAKTWQEKTIEDEKTQFPPPKKQPTQSKKSPDRLSFFRIGQTNDRFVMISTIGEAKKKHKELCFLPHSQFVRHTRRKFHEGQKLLLSLLVFLMRTYKMSGIF